MMTISSLINMIRAASNKIKDDYVNVFSAQAAFYVIICAFPFAMFLLTMVRYLPITPEKIIELCSHVFPSTLDTFINPLIYELYNSASTTLLSVTVITTLWSASRGFLAITRGLEKIYSITEHHNYIIKRLLSAVYTLIFAVSLILLLFIFVFGNSIYGWIVTRIPILADFALLIISMRTIIGLAFLTLFFLLIYTFIPKRKTNFLKEFPGALLSAAGWMGFSFLYSFYIDNMGNFSATYGSLTAIVLCMLWLYACMYIMFLGAELNALLATPSFRTSLSNMFHKFRQNRKHKKEVKSRK